MNCKKCGSPLIEGDLFCKNCGASVNAQEEQNNIQQPITSQPDLTQQPVNSQPEQTPQPMSIHPEPIQPPVNAPQSMDNMQPVNNAQPMNNMTPNYPNNNQTPLQYNSAPTPNYQQPKQNGGSKFLGIGIAVAVVVVGIIFGMKFLGNDGNNNSGGKISSNVTSTYKVRFKGFTFKVPNNLIYDTDSSAMYINDETDTWRATIEVVSGSFNNLQTNIDRIIPTYQAAGYVASNVKQNNYSGMDFITVELAKSGYNAILGFAKGNSMYLLGATVYNIDNSYDYDLIKTIAQIFSTAEYYDESNSISTFEKVDMGSINELAKADEEK